MEFNIDECKINKNNVYISGWCHKTKYKIKVVSKGEEKYIQNYIPRFDICIAFHEKIDNNCYGFKEELTFDDNVKKLNIFLEDEKESILIYKYDNRKIINILKKIKKFLGKIKRGIKFLWREYHFLVPPVMIKEYIKMILKDDKKKSVYNPRIISEYNSWLNSKNYEETDKTISEKITIISDFSNEYVNYVVDDDFSKIIDKVKTEYVCLIKGKIKLESKFLSVVENELKDNKSDLIYFDNDFVISDVYQNPILKPDWSKDTLLGVNYIGNCFIIRKNLLKNEKTFNLYKILLNQLDKEIVVKHIPIILYHDYNSISNGKKELLEYLRKNKIEAEVKTNYDGITNTLIYKVDGKDLVSIIIPTKDHAMILEKCLVSIYEKTTYKNYEIIVIDNNSEEKETFDLLKKYKKKYKNFNYKRIECEFNYSYINNEAVKMSKGNYIVLLNNDIEVITPEWLEYMLGYAKQKHVGTVGAKLIFPDETIQHAGIIIGKGGIAGHAHYAEKRNTESFNYELSIPYNYSACTAACLMIKKSVFLSVGGLEEKLKVAFNDVDLNLKILEKGYYNVFLPNVELYHHESKSRGLDTSLEKQKRFAQECSYIKEKWGKYLNHDKFYNDNLSKDYDYMLK